MTFVLFRIFPYSLCYGLIPSYVLPMLVDFCNNLLKTNFIQTNSKDMVFSPHVLFSSFLIFPWLAVPPYQPFQKAPSVEYTVSFFVYFVPQFA